MKELSLLEVLQMTQEDLSDLFSENNSVVVVPPGGYELVIEHIEYVDDLLTIVKYLAKLLIPSKLFISDEDFNSHPLKKFLNRVD